MQLLRIGLVLVCAFFLEMAATKNRVEAACPEDSLPCDDGRECVKRNEWCDKSIQCQDKSDEAYCKKKRWFSGGDPNTCKDTHFLCDDGLCVPLVAKCDGFKDCVNGTDEKCEPEPTDDYYDYGTSAVEITTEQSTTPEVFSNIIDQDDISKTSSEPARFYDSRLPYQWRPSSTLLTRSYVASTRAYDSMRGSHSEEDIAQNVTQPSAPSYLQPTTLEIKPGVTPYVQPTVNPTGHQSTCSDGGFRCDDQTPTTRYGHSSSNNCVSRSSFCNGRNDCSNKRDELYCDDYLTQFNGGCPFLWFKCNDGRCIPSNWQCNGFVDCLDESDESLCSYLTRNQVILTESPPTIATISARDGRTLGDGSAKRKLLDWFVGRRKNGTGTNKWGHELPRIAIALFLAEKEFFEPENRTMEEMNYELTIQLLSQMTGGGNLKRKDLSLYIHALMVTCVDPRNFHGRDLVSELRSIVDSRNETASSFDLLVLCNAGDTMTDKDVGKITAAFDSQHRPFWTDNQAMATLALACISSRPGVTVDERTVMDMAQELKKRQFRNGTVDNLKTTALVVQALIATQSVQRDFDLDAALRVIQNAQREDGSIGSFLDSYYILPVLSNSSLLNVTSKHCKRPTTSEAEALSELQSRHGQRLVIQFSVWIGTEVDLKRTWTLKVPVNSSLYNILETVNRLDTRQQVLYNVLDGKPYVSSLMGLQDDVETGLYWFTYLRRAKDGEPTLVEESPVDVKIRSNQELILWYKSGQWNKLSPELTTQS